MTIYLLASTKQEQQQQHQQSKRNEKYCNVFSVHGDFLCL